MTCREIKGVVHAHMEEINGIPTFIVDGKPFLVLGAQCDIWRSTWQNEKTVEFFDGYKEMNATTVGIGIPWSYIEKSEDQYDFSFMQWFIDRAKEREMKLFLNLFNTNVCGKVFEISYDSKGYPQYTPDYILNHPETYQRMLLPQDYKYVSGGPPMCPNDSNTLVREVKYVKKVAEYLREFDTKRTVIALQINNEFYYQQWEGERPSIKEKVRCYCKNCNQKYNTDLYETEEVFMFRSFADYVRVLTDEIAQIYDLPLYVNSPWWDPYIIPIFLDHCPNLDFVGIDGIISPYEPNWLSTGQLGRNIAFASESPTENERTKNNLSVLPYYVITKRNGIGDLLWEAPEPDTVVYDEKSRECFKRALYPLKHAMAPILRARNTDRFIGWYAIRENMDIYEEADVFGNITKLSEPKKVFYQQMVTVEGTSERNVDDEFFDLEWEDFKLHLSDTDAGMIVKVNSNEFIIITAKAHIEISGNVKIAAHSGVFAGDDWHPRKPVALEDKDGTYVLHIHEPNVIKVVKQQGGEL